MKKTESYLIAVLAIMLLLIRVTYYVLAFGFDREIDSLRNISGNLIFFFFLYITFKYIRLLSKDNEKSIEL